MARGTHVGELRSVNPATLEPVGSVPVSAPEEIAEVVADARLAAERWAQSSFAERRALFGRVASVVLDGAGDIAATVTAETGKPLVESYTAELFVALDNLLWAASNAGRALRPERVRYRQLHLRHKRGWLLYEPLGVVGVISPWNFPFGIPFTQAAFAVAAGNAVVVKPSELTPLSGAWVERAFREAGAPDGLVRVVQGGAEAGEALVRAPGAAKVVFTGSGETARRVASLAGERLRPVTLELGGKDPMLVFEDADLDRAVAGALWGAFSNCGQVCSGVERIYVAWPLLEAFVEELARRARSLRIGRGDARRLEAGSVWTNDVSYSYGTGQASWGGTKESGFGRTHSKHGLYELSRVKFADLDRGRVPVPWWFPYDRLGPEGLRGMLGVLYGQGLGPELEAAWRHRRGLIALGRRYLSGP